MKTTRGLFVGCCLIAVSIPAPAVEAAWMANGTLVDAGLTGFPVMDLRMVPDGMCGAAIAWHFGDLGYNSVQRLDWNGDLQFLPDPVSQTGEFAIGSPEIASDMAGGVFIAGVGNTPFMMMAITCSHVGLAGDVVRVDLFTGPFDGWRLEPRLISDGSGGCVIVWREILTDQYGVKIQRVDSDDNILWTENGHVVCEASTPRYGPVLAPDGGGGAIVVWRDFRSGSAALYAQRVYFSGTNLWTADGVQICACDASTTP